MDRETELDMLAGDTQRILADTVITVRARRPASRYDSATGLRAHDLDEPEAVDIAAVVDDDVPQRSGDKHTRRRAWIVLGADLGFNPSRASEVEENGVVYRLTERARMNDGREWRLVGERGE
jgi:hypothetical protein